MKKMRLYAVVCMMMVSVFAGCGKEKSIREVSDAPCDPPAETVEYCSHIYTDDRGICRSCHKSVGVSLTMDDPKEIFVIESHQVENFGGAWKIKIYPKPEYKGRRFTNVSILLKGTKLASDGWTLNRDEELLSIALDENGEAEWSGLLGEILETPYWRLGQTVFGVMPRMH